LTITEYFIFPSHLTSGSALSGETGNPEIAALCLNAVLLHCQDVKQLLVKFIQSCYLQLILMLLYHFLNLIVSGVKLWTLMGP